MKVGDLVRYKSGTIWDVEDLFFVLKITKPTPNWHKKILLYNPWAETGSIWVSWDEREILEVISEAD